MTQTAEQDPRRWRLAVAFPIVVAVTAGTLLVLNTPGRHAGASPGQQMAADFAVLAKPFDNEDALPPGAQLLRPGGDTGPVESGSSVRRATAAASPVAVWIGQADSALCLHVSLDGGRSVSGGACQTASGLAARGGGVMVIPGTDTTVVALAPDGYAARATLELPDGTEQPLAMGRNVAVGTVHSSDGGQASVTLSGPDGDRVMPVPLGVG